MVVIAIIGILAAVVLVNIWGSTAKARDARRIADIGAIAKALHMYHLENGEYPFSSGGVNNREIGIGGAVDSELSSYMSEVPADPLSPESGYGYYYNHNRNCSVTSSSQVTAVWVRTMEDVSKGNWTEICSPGSSAAPEARMIILAPAS